MRGSLSGKKYGAILIDPSWAFKTFTKVDAIAHRCAEQHYRTMPLNEICGLPVPDFAAKNCALFMWVSTPHLREAFTVLDAWGFKFKTRAFEWVKLKDNQIDFFDPPPARMSMGYWTRKQAEMCLLATRGHPKRLSKAVREIIAAPRREHSRKPDEIYGRIEALVDGPYLEMFARQRWPGWEQWGDEVDKFQVAIK